MNDRTGFTLIELLVTLSIIGLLMAMLLPAVQSVRESSRRIACKNKMRQLGVATLNYDSSFGYLPPGTLGYEHSVEWSDFRSTPDVPYWKRVPHTSAFALLLPFMEGSNVQELLSPTMLRKELDPSFDWFGETAQFKEVCATKVSQLLCPSDAEMVSRQGSGIRVSGGSQPVLTNGTYSDGFSFVEWLNVEIPGDYFGTNYLGCSGAVSGGRHPDPSRNAFRGLMSSGERIRTGAVKDGTSNTFLIGETIGSVSGTKRKNIQCWLIGGLARGRGPVFWEDAFDNRTKILGTSNDSHQFGFASMHPGIINFLRGDGSVGSIRPSVDNSAFLTMCGAFDGFTNSVDP